MLHPATFIATYRAPIIRSTIGTGIFPSVKMAQAALETGWGKSSIGNNLFGIKARGNHSPYWKGHAITADTTEYIQGEAGIYKEGFRVYNSIEDSIRDHTHFLQTNPRYKANNVFAAETPEAQAMALQTAGYATDPNYATKLINIINQHNLKELDEKKKIIHRTLGAGTMIIIIGIALAIYHFLLK